MSSIFSKSGGRTFVTETSLLLSHYVVHVFTMHSFHQIQHVVSHTYYYSRIINIEVTQKPV